MHFVKKSLLEMAAPEWYLLAAYLGIFVLLEFRKFGERMATHRLVTRALWAASVAAWHSIVATATMIRRTSLDFFFVDYAAVMTLTGSLVHLLSCMCEGDRQPAFVRSRRSQ